MESVFTTEELLAQHKTDCIDQMYESGGLNMKKYRVCLIKYETYYVDAENEETALNKAYILDENNWLAWADPVDKIEIEEVKREVTEYNKEKGEL